MFKKKAPKVILREGKQNLFHKILKCDFLQFGINEIIILKSFLTNFEGIVIFRGSWGSSENLTTISKFNQIELVQILETLWTHTHAYWSIPILSFSLGQSDWFQTHSHKRKWER